MADDTLNEKPEKSLEKVESILITTAKCCLKIMKQIKLVEISSYLQTKNGSIKSAA